MKKGLLGSTALVAATALTVGMAQAAEAPTAKLSGFMNFQAYVPDLDGAPAGSDDRPVYFATDDAEIIVNVKGTADNGLTYGFKVELEATQGSGGNADEARIQLGGSWGTLQLGDEDGADDIMMYGSENVLGATGGYDGDQGNWAAGTINPYDAAASPDVAGDNNDDTKISYFSPRFSGFQLGVSYTPQNSSGDSDAIDAGDFENYFGLGANYDGTFGDVRVRLSGIYLTASADDAANPTREDIASWRVGGIVGFGPVSVAAAYGDNGDYNGSGTDFVDQGESSYWDVGAAYSAGPITAAVGYFSGTGNATGNTEDEYTHLALTVDYSVAPGLGVYAEYDDASAERTGSPSVDSSAFIVGANVSF